MFQVVRDGWWFGSTHFRHPQCDFPTLPFWQRCSFGVWVATGTSWSPSYSVHAPSPSNTRPRRRIFVVLPLAVLSDRPGSLSRHLLQLLWVALRLEGARRVLPHEEQFPHSVQSSRRVFYHFKSITRQKPYRKYPKVRSMLQKLVHHSMVTLVTGFEQRSCSIVSHGIDVGSVLKQNFDNVIVSHLTSDPERRCAVVSRNVRVSSSGQQHQQNSSMPVLCSDKEWRRSILWTLETIFKFVVYVSTHDCVTSHSIFGISTSIAWTLPSWKRLHWHQKSAVPSQYWHDRLGMRQRALCRRRQTHSQLLRQLWGEPSWFRGNRLAQQRRERSCRSASKKIIRIEQPMVVTWDHMHHSFCIDVSALVEQLQYAAGMATSSRQNQRRCVILWKTN